MKWQSLSKLYYKTFLKISLICFVKNLLLCKIDFAWRHIQAHKPLNKKIFSRIFVASLSEIGIIDKSESIFVAEGFYWELVTLIDSRNSEPKGISSFNICQTHAIKGSSKVWLFPQASVLSIDPESILLGDIFKPKNPLYSKVLGDLSIALFSEIDMTSQIDRRAIERVWDWLLRSAGNFFRASPWFGSIDV